MAVLKRLRRAAAFFAKAAVRFYRDECLMQASALAYVSLLSLVPFLAVVFAVLKGLGVPRRVEPMVLGRLGLAAETVATVLSAIERVNVSVVGAVGGVLLLTSVVSLLAGIEGALNRVWRVRQGRTWWRRLTEYLGLVLLLPFLLLGAIALTSSLHLGHMVRLAEGVPVVGELIHWTLLVAPMVLNGVGLLLLYVVLPNRVPDWRAVSVGAVIGAVLWQVVQWFYVSLQIGVARYSAVYGALAQLPITLVWFYATWAVFLFGAQCAAVAEFGNAVPASPRCPRSIMALQALRSAWLAFYRGSRSLDLVSWAKTHGVSLDTALGIFGALSAWGWLRPSAGENAKHYMVASHPRSWQFSRLAELDDDQVCGSVDSVVGQVWQVMQVWRAERWNHLREIPLGQEVFPGVVFGEPSSRGGGEK